MNIIHKCINCNKEFFIPERRIRHRERNNLSPFKYCSSYCRIQYNKPKEERRICIVCNKEFTTLHRKKTKCCSRKCADKISNPKKLKKCKICNTVFYGPRNFCKNCIESGRFRYKKFKYKLPTEMMLKDVVKRSGANRFDVVRFWARSSIPNVGSAVCETCGYDKHVEVSHKKPIKDFDINTPISVINDRNNLMLLCPNCHWEYDHKIK